ncbi:RICIN domain-containing protein [Aeromonas hydrophila]|uniref:RICIN domain-containing protein n=1 Tax=Aeromonas TaxID=642 RepID=UPI000E57AE79|nr:MULTISPECIES: RICIN domain-containing protein [Aeromonas]AXV32423.1 lectin [Aeromonas hydrophila]EHA1068452.1 RICIN domain-containing protein [Aeromonas hydrophila]MBM0438974.1 lectin [Aeromonas hydrophila subsp. ranae]MBW3828542.1 RICIN domain-containing protein [Aeromonas hydrophila]MCO4209433.1 RICIN domain-containing protein [Aeromonas hydrophila]
MHPNSFRVSTLALVVVALSGCSYKPKPDEILMGAAPMQSIATSALVTDAGFCVALNDHNQLITQPCDQTVRQQFSWDAGALQLDQRCLVAKGVSELTMAECQDESRQWQWQEDRLFNSKADRCLDVAGRRHKPGTPLRLADCFGGANQSFAWQNKSSMFDKLNLKSLIW